MVESPNDGLRSDGSREAPSAEGPHPEGASPERETTDPPVTELLAALSRGDSEAFDRLIPLVYDDLRRIAHRHLARERDGHTLNTTALVHEAYLRLVDQTRADWSDRAHFFAVASRVMRHILIDYARWRGREKRGGDAVRVPLERAPAARGKARSAATIDLLMLDEALTRLADRHRRMGRVVECRLYGGMQMKEIAAALQTSLSTVERDWRRAKAYLYQDLAPEAGR